MYGTNNNSTFAHVSRLNSCTEGLMRASHSVLLREGRANHYIQNDSQLSQRHASSHYAWYRIGLDKRSSSFVPYFIGTKWILKMTMHEVR